MLRKNIKIYYFWKKNLGDFSINYVYKYVNRKLAKKSPIFLHVKIVIIHVVKKVTIKNTNLLQNING